MDGDAVFAASTGVARPIPTLRDKIEIGAGGKTDGRDTLPNAHRGALDAVRDMENQPMEDEPKRVRDDLETLLATREAITRA